MMTNTNTDIVSTRKTFDGVTVYLHADGAVSDHQAILSAQVRTRGFDVNGVLRRWS